MSCLHCTAAHQSGRFCTGCGKRMPRTEFSSRTTWRVRRVAATRSREPMHRGEERARAIRVGQSPGPADRAEKRSFSEDAVASQRVDVRGMYDKAMARAAVHARDPLQRYLAVLATSS